MIKGKNMNKQLDLYKKLEAVILSNESSIYDPQENKDGRESVASPVNHSQGTIDYESGSQVMDQLGELTIQKSRSPSRSPLHDSTKLATPLTG